MFIYGLSRSDASAAMSGRPGKIEGLPILKGKTKLRITDSVELGIQAAFGAPGAAGNSPFINRLAAVR
jgi:hypothetical protein